MAIDLSTVTVEVELVAVQENLLTLKDEMLVFVRMFLDGRVLSEGLAIFPAD